MGGFYGSIQVRTTDRAAVKTAAEAVAKEKSLRCLIGPEINGWVGVYPADQEESVAGAIAEVLACDVLHLMVHDDDVLGYQFWREHKLVDSYWSQPGCLGDENLAEEEAQRGDAEKFRGIVGADLAKLAAVLDREAEYTFEGDRLKKLAKLLGISNAVTHYDLLTSDERSGIKGWRKFEKIPPDPIAPAKPKAPSRKSIREKLKKSGLLLYSHEWKEFTQLLHGFPMGEGFVLGWVDPWRNTAGLHQLTPPLYIPEALPFDPDQAHANVQGKFAVVASGDTLRIMDKSSSPWKLVSEIPQIDQVGFAAISPNGEFIAHLNQLKMIVRDARSGDRVCEVSRLRSGRIAFHPTEKWLSVTGDTLSILCFDENFQVKSIYVGDNKPVVIDIIRGIEELRCIGFSRDGRLLWCGSKLGLQIYEWESLSKQESRKPRWLLRLQNPVTAIAEEADRASIVFGTCAGKLARFDLHTGELHKLADLPNGGRVEHLMFSADSKALAVATELRTEKGRRSMPKLTRAWEIWDYGKLRESGRFLGRAEKKEPAPHDEASPEDLTTWRRVTAKGRRREGA